MEINKDAILIKMAEKEYSRQALATASGLKYWVVAEGLSRGRMTTENIGKIAHALDCKVEEIVT